MKINNFYKIVFVLVVTFFSPKAHGQNILMLKDGTKLFGSINGYSSISVKIKVYGKIAKDSTGRQIAVPGIEKKVRLVSASDIDYFYLATEQQYYYSKQTPPDYSQVSSSSHTLLKLETEGALTVYSHTYGTTGYSNVGVAGGVSSRSVTDYFVESQTGELRCVSFNLLTEPWKKEAIRAWVVSLFSDNEELQARYMESRQTSNVILDYIKEYNEKKNVIIKY